MSITFTEALAVVFPETFVANVRGQAYRLDDLHSLCEAGARKVVEYGLQRISNDAAANAKDDAEAISFADKRWDNLRQGVVRASGTRTADPIRRRALEIAEGKVKASPKFIAWCQAQGFKISDKRAVAAMREQAKKHAESFMAQAKIDVEAQASLPELDLDF